MAQPLKHAAHDAVEMTAMLGMPEFGFKVEQLRDAEATVKTVQDAVDNLLGSTAGMKLLYFSGHGYVIETEPYLVTSDDSDTCPGVSLEWLRTRVAEAAGTVMLIFDCCHSGAAAPKASSLRRLSEGDLDRSLGEALGEGKILIAACGADEPAYEADEMEHGVFTFHLLDGLMGAAADRQGVVTPLGLYDHVAQRLREDGRQSPVMKGEITGQIIVGAGFAALYPLPTDEREAPDEMLGSIEEEAHDLLDEYLKQVAVSYEQWKAVGFRQASQLLEPLLRWFDRHIREHPELLSRQAFREAHAEAQARLAGLGNLSEGTWTDEGQVSTCLGAGAFGTVWKVEREGQAALAYKVYHSNELPIKEKRVRFGRGYRAMKQLDHPHIVKVHRYTDSPVGFYMDCIDGPNLRQFAGSLREPSDTLSLLFKIAETLQHAHGRNVIHRDVKPENIIVTYDRDKDVWDPYLTDFDLAWFSTATQVTKDAFGAIFYAAPEQLTKPSSRAAHSRTTDVFSFGRLCYFVVAGSDPIPFGGADDRRALAEMIGHWAVAEAANAFLDLYEDCTRDRPSDRPQTFRLVVDRLFRAFQLLRDVDERQRIDPEHFIEELIYAAAGLSTERRLAPNAFRSLSGRTAASITDIHEISGRINLTLQLSQDFLSVEGVSHARARQVLNQRLDTALRSYPDVTRRPGGRGPYEVFLDLKHLEPALVGVNAAREILTRAIDAIESS